MFINDLMQDIQALNIGNDLGDHKLGALLYADDVVVLGETEGDLQTTLDIVAAWCNKWGLSINPKKTKILHFRPKRKSCSSFCFHLGDMSLNFAHDYKYLGFWLNEFLDMEESISKILDSTSRALGLLIAKTKSNGGFPLSIFSRIFDATVSPIIEFSAHLWAFKERPKVNQIQYHALRFFFGLGKASPTAALIGDSGWVPLQMRLEYNLLKYWYCVHNLPQERLPKKTFIWAGNVADVGKKIWVSQVRLLLEDLNLSNVFLNVGNNKKKTLTKLNVGVPRIKVLS